MWARTIVRRSLPKRGGRGPSRGQTISAFALKHSQESEEKSDVVLNSEKNVGIVLFGFPPNAGAIGTAAYLSVFESLHNTLQKMAENG